MSGDRLKKLNDLISFQIGHIVRKDIEFPLGVLVTVVLTDVSRTFEHANVFVSVIPDGDRNEALKILQKNIFSIQKSLNKKLMMRPVPKIKFMSYHGSEYSERIEKIIENL